VYKFDGRIQNFQDKLGETITHDNNELILTIYAGWKISDASEFYPKFLGSVPYAQTALEGMLRNAKIAVVSTNNLSAFVNPDPAQLHFDQMEQQIQDIVQSELSTNQYGIELEFVGFKKIELPQSVTQSVFDRMRKERQVLINREQFDGIKEASFIKSTADRQAAETIANANAIAVHIQGEGEAAAAKVLPVFEQNPALANYLLKLDALQQALDRQTTLIFDERTPPFDLFTGIPTNGPSQ
jgi:membrane protease subunit HflC